MRYIILASLMSMIGVGLLSRTAPTPEPAPPELEGWQLEVSETPVQTAPPRPGAQPVPPTSGGLVGGVFLDERSQTYAVQGSTEQEILASLQAGGPSASGKTFFGLTASESSYQLQPRMTGNACVASDVRVELAVTITLPDWTPSEDAPYELQRDWTRFETALTRHEAQHRDIAVKGAESIREALRGFSRATCQDVEFEARQRAERIAQATEKEHQRFDEQTDHGRTQGAQWPLP